MRYRPLRGLSGSSDLGKAPLKLAIPTSERDASIELEDASRRIGEEPLHEIRVSILERFTSCQVIQTFLNLRMLEPVYPLLGPLPGGIAPPEFTRSFQILFAWHCTMLLMSSAARRELTHWSNLPARTIANPLISSRMPSSSENPGLKPVRSIFSFDTM